MDKINTYTSTGSKLLFHPEFLSRAKEQGLLSPISIQIALTAMCQLSCSFCSNKNRTKTETLSYDFVINTLEKFRSCGAKTAEFTGGGDPLLHPQINEIIEHAWTIGYRIGLITNGVALERLTPDSLRKLHWIRISMNCLDYVESIDIPEMPKSVTLGFSYVISDDTDIVESKAKLDLYSDKYMPAYIRCVQNCKNSHEDQDRNNITFETMVSGWGSPYIYQNKSFNRPETCYWCYVKPFIFCDSYVYPCSSVVLNSDSDEKFHEKYRWKTVDELIDAYNHQPVSFNNDSCDKCVFEIQCNEVDSIMNPSNMEDFV